MSLAAIGAKRIAAFAALTLLSPCWLASPAASFAQRTAARERGTCERNLPCHCNLVFTETEMRSLPRRGERHIYHIVVDARGAILLNGTPVSATVLRQYLDRGLSLVPPSLVTARAEPGAPPDATSAVRNAIYRSYFCVLDRL